MKTDQGVAERTRVGFVVQPLDHGGDLVRIHGPSRVAVIVEQDHDGFAGKGGQCRYSVLTDKLTRAEIFFTFVEDIDSRCPSVIDVQVEVADGGADAHDVCLFLFGRHVRCSIAMAVTVDMGRRPDSMAAMPSRVNPSKMANCAWVRLRSQRIKRS